MQLKFNVVVIPFVYWTVQSQKEKLLLNNSVVIVKLNNSVTLFLMVCEDEGSRLI